MFTVHKNTKSGLMIFKFMKSCIPRTKGLKSNLLPLFISVQTADGQTHTLPHYHCRVWQSSPGLDLTFSIVVEPTGLRIEEQFVIRK